MRSGVHCLRSAAFPAADRVADRVAAFAAAAERYLLHKAQSSILLCW